MSMDADARDALAVIRQCVAGGRYEAAFHFRQRLAERGLFWSDVLTVLDSPADVRDQGPDRFDRPKWIVAGPGADGTPLEIVCVLDEDERGDWTVFITIYGG